MDRDKLELIKVNDLTKSEINSVKIFMDSLDTNGEFINSFDYLAYHPQGRFQEDSVVVCDKASKTIRGVLLATVDRDDEHTVISHSGTTFAGPIISQKLSIDKTETVLDIMMSYYEQKYNQIILRTTPPYYTTQPFDTIGYFLLRRGYALGMTALANINHISGLHTEDDVLQQFNGAKRNQTRKVLKGKMFVFNTSTEIRPEVWAQMEKNLHKKFNSKTTHTYAEICDLVQRVPGKIQAAYVDTVDGQYGAFALVYKFKNVYHTQYLDTNYQYTGEYPNLLLILRLMQNATKEGYRYFSLGGSTEEGGKLLNLGLYNYKIGYGGGNIILPQYTWRKNS